MNDVSKLKYGTDVVWSALSWFGIGVRADRVQPNNKIPEQSFAILSPRLFFRSKWVTHEEIQLQYSRYMYNQRTGQAAPGVTPAPNPANAGYEPGQEYCVQPASGPVLPIFQRHGRRLPRPSNQDPNIRGAPNTTPANVIKIRRACGGEHESHSHGGCSCGAPVSPKRSPEAPRAPKTRPGATCSGDGV
jgi:hypothetical protein